MFEHVEKVLHRQRTKAKKKYDDNYYNNNANEAHIQITGGSENGRVVMGEERRAACNKRVGSRDIYSFIDAI